MDKIIEKNFSNLYNHHLDATFYKNAIDDGIISITFGELEYAAVTYAAYLQANNFNKGDRVIISTQRTTHTLVSIFAVLKAGGVFIPVDSDIPQGRLNATVAEANPVFISEDLKIKNPNLTVKGLNNSLLVNIIDEAIKCKGKNLKATVKPVIIYEEDLCYIIFTSGSTGKPKGVPISHLNFMSFVESLEEVYPIHLESKCLGTIPYHFDASMEDFYALSQGGELCITPLIAFPKLIVEIIERKKISNIATTPSVLNLLYQYLKRKNYSPDFSSIKSIIMGGEVCDKRILNHLFDLNDKMVIINGYGPTEATCDAVTYTIRGKSFTDGYFPIGKPLKNIEAVLLNEEMELINTIGAKGELLLSGKQVFKGYLNNTKGEGFIVLNDKRYYKTGDICFIDENGAYNFLGRNNQELKLNGFRVHLNEIKSLITSLENVVNAEVFVLENDTKKEKYISVAVAFSTEVSNFIDLMDFLSRNLPYYMIPSSCIAFGKLPLLPNTKVDRKKIEKLLINNAKLLEKGHYVYLEKDNKLALLKNELV